MVAKPTITNDVCAVYARYSSDLQSPRSIVDQVERLRGEVAKHGGTFNERLVFSDGETSGAVWERPGFQALLRAVEEGRVRRIFTEDVSRMSRDPEDQARLRKRLDYYGVQLVSVDGVELDGTSRASLSFGVKSLFAEQYLKDLGDKTRRGLFGNAREGKSTGGRTYGYGTGSHSTIVVDPEQAPTVRRIFALYANGYGYARIAGELNHDGIQPPRSKRRAGEGWMASCIREMLRNPKYIGGWSFGTREWRRHPDTRRRVVRERSEDGVFRVDRPELAIVDRGVWDAVQARLVEHTRERKAASEPGRLPRKPTAYLLSSLLRCGCCGGLLQISGGSPNRYYRCATNRKRGAAQCANALSVRESVARERIMAAIRGTMASPSAMAYVRKRIAESLGQLSREVETELTERRTRLTRVEERIRGMITMQLDGDRSPTLAQMRQDAEAQAFSERAAIGALRAQSVEPIRLPDAHALIARVQSLDALAAGDDVEGAREALRRYLKGGAISCTPEATGYVARAELIPLAGFLDGPEMKNAAELRGPAALSSDGCAGAIRPMYHEVSVEIRLQLSA